jgi:hypothetical protein
MHSGNINDLSYYYFPEALKKFTIFRAKCRWKKLHEKFILKFNSNSSKLLLEIEKKTSFSPGI